MCSGNDETQAPSMRDRRLGDGWSVSKITFPFASVSISAM